MNSSKFIIVIIVSVLSVQSIADAKRRKNGQEFILAQPDDPQASSSLYLNNNNNSSNTQVGSIEGVVDVVANTNSSLMIDRTAEPDERKIVVDVDVTSQEKDVNGNPKLQWRTNLTGSINGQTRRLSDTINPQLLVDRDDRRLRKINKSNSHQGEGRRRDGLYEGDDDVSTPVPDAINETTVVIISDETTTTELKTTVTTTNEISSTMSSSSSNPDDNPTSTMINTSDYTETATDVTEDTTIMSTTRKNSAYTSKTNFILIAISMSVTLVMLASDRPTTNNVA